MRPYECKEKCQDDMRFYTIDNNNSKQCLSSCEYNFVVQRECIYVDQTCQADSENAELFNAIETPEDAEKFIKNDIMTIPCGVRQIGNQIRIYEKSKYNERFQQIEGTTLLQGIIIPDSVTSITSYDKEYQDTGGAFFSCKGLKEMNLPDSISFINENTFEQCENLKSIKIPKYVQNIQQSSFGGCINLQQLELSYNIQSIRYAAFYSCNKLQKIILPNNLKIIEEEAFDSCLSLQQIIIPNSVIYIDKRAFNDCNNLQYVQLSNSITQIFLDTFSGVYNLRSISIPDNIIKIDAYAFQQAQHLQCISFNHQNIVIDQDAFDNTPFEGYSLYQFNDTCPDQQVYICNNSENEYFLFEDKEQYCIKKNYVNYYIVNQDNQNSKPQALSQCTTEKPFYILKTQQPSECINECPSTHKYYVLDDNDSIQCLQTCNNIQQFCSKFQEISLTPDEQNKAEQFNNAINGNIEQFIENNVLTIPKGVKIISQQIQNYANNKDVVKVIIPDTVLILGDNAFKYCEEITEITWPQYLIKIGRFAFYECKNLQQINLPQTTQFIGEYGFYDCSYLTNAILPNQVQVLHKSTFTYCGSLINVTLPDQLRIIYGEAFYECFELQNVNIKNKLQYIGYAAFNECSRLKQLILPDSVTQIQQYGLSYISDLAYIQLPRNITILKRNIIDRNYLNYIIIPESVQVIQSAMLSDCYKLSCIAILNKQCQLEKNAFATGNYSEFTSPSQFNETCSIDINKIVECDTITSTTKYIINVENQEKCTDEINVKYYKQDNIDNNKRYVMDTCYGNEPYYILNQQYPIQCISLCPSDYKKTVDLISPNTCQQECPQDYYETTDGQGCTIQCDKYYTFNNNVKQIKRCMENQKCNDTYKYISIYNYHECIQNCSQDQSGHDYLWIKYSDDYICQDQTLCKDIIDYTYYSSYNNDQCVQNCGTDSQNNNIVWYYITKYDQQEKQCSEKSISCPPTENTDMQFVIYQTDQCSQTCNNVWYYSSQNNENNVKLCLIDGYCTQLEDKPIQASNQCVDKCSNSDNYKFIELNSEQCVQQCQELYWYINSNNDYQCIESCQSQNLTTLELNSYQCSSTLPSNNQYYAIITIDNIETKVYIENMSSCNQFAAIPQQDISKMIYNYEDSYQCTDCTQSDYKIKDSQCIKQSKKSNQVVTIVVPIVVVVVIIITAVVTVIIVKKKKNQENLKKNTDMKNPDIQSVI